ncbi:hypothetical protein [Arthrobacter sp. 35W]|uniref:hypothetical protein n=1 Tax=Arthrobacter sp. 35W TaxID=1132441 RepID=UPI0009E02E56|nr:hypothetical protein [Arthrobacter sp. 35W]
MTPNTSTNRPHELEDIERFGAPAETAILPDGTLVIFTRTETLNGNAHSSLWAVSDGSEARPRGAYLGSRYMPHSDAS